MELLNGYILVRVEPVKEKTAGGILLAEGTQKLPGRGTVELVAKEVTSVKVGDKVEFLRYAAIDGTEEDTRLCTEKHIVGIYESEA